MTATATRDGPSSTSAGHSTFGGGLNLSGTYRAPRFARPPKGPRPKPIPEPSLPSAQPAAPPGRVIHAKIEDRIQFKDSVVVIKAVAHGATYALIQVTDSAVPRKEPAPSKPRTLSPERIARKMAALKAFTKHMQHREYLNRVSAGERPSITLETAAKAMKAWNAIWIASGGLMPIPAACTGPDGEMFYSWDRGRHHLELEIIPGQHAEFFYRDRETEQLWGEDYNIGEPLSAEAIQKLQLFR